MTSVAADRPPRSPAVPGLALLQLALLLVTNTRFGLHGDELYYLACARHLDWGYVDIGPLVPWVVALSTSLLGDSTFAVRLPAALAAAGLVLLSGRLCRQLGGGRRAQTLTALAVVIAPAILRASFMIQAPALEPLAWTGCIAILVAILQGGSPRLWLAFGLVAGLGLLIKSTMLLLGLGVLIGLALTSHRRLLATRWPWLGGLVALVVFAPHLVWQQIHGWPTVAFMAGIRERTLQGISAPEFLIGQVIYLHPFNLPIWLAGLWTCLVSRRALLAPLGVAYLTCLGVFLLTHAKAYYLLPVYPSLLAAGALGLERWLAAGTLRRRVTYATLAVGGLVFAPAAVAVLPVDRMAAYAETITFGAMENSSEVTEDLRRMHGWQELVDAIAAAYEQLDPDEQARAVVWTGAYSQAAAVDHLGRDRGLPPAHSLHMSYHLWGPPPPERDVVISCGINEDSLRFRFARVDNPVTAEAEDAMWRRLPIWVCREPVEPLGELWERVRHY